MRMSDKENDWTRAGHPEYRTSKSGKSERIRTKKTRDKLKGVSKNSLSYDGLKANKKG